MRALQLMRHQKLRQRIEDSTEWSHETTAPSRRFETLLMGGQVIYLAGRPSGPALKQLCAILAESAEAVCRCAA